MATLHNLYLPDEVYEQLQELAAAKESSIDAQLITLLQNGLSIVQKQRIAEQRQQNVTQLLEESRCRREMLPTDIEWPDSTATIREDCDR